MKILYNITYKINLESHNKWLKWMKENHIPSITNSMMFESHRFCKLLRQDETDGMTYSLQFICKDMKTLQLYSAKFAPKLQEQHKAKFHGKYVSFRTLLEILD